MTRIQLFSLGFTFLAACGELSRTPGESDAGSDGGHTSPRLRCDDCRDARAMCVNNTCAATCDPLEPFPCVDGFRCVEDVCLPEFEPSCDAWPCNPDQRCVSTYCVGVGTEGCDPLNDDCGTERVCLGEPPTCSVRPRCDVDDTCRPGTLGAVCNRARTGVRLDPRTAQGFCLLGRCTSHDHCPAPLTCQEIGAEVEGLGVCR